MQIITGSRQSGKTTKLIQKAHETYSTIICSNLRRCEHISRMAEKLKINILPPITIKQYLEGASRRIQSNFAFDEVFDCFYQILPRGDFTFASFTIEEEQV